MQKIVGHMVIWAMFILSLFLFTECEKQSSEDKKEAVVFNLSLNYDVSEFIFDGTNILGTSAPMGLGISESEELIRYIIRVYPIAKNSAACVKEFEFTRELAMGYNCNTTIELAPGDYEIMVWSDIVKDNQPLYDTDDFAEIKLIGTHEGNNAYYDAFRGKVSISQADFDNGATIERAINITMQRPLAKFEFVANDLLEFINKEFADRPASYDADQTTIDFSDYKVVFYYVGFMPDTYSMFTDRPVDSSTGVIFESSLNVLTENEASLGFDYVFVNERESAVTVRVGVYDVNQELVSLTSPIKVPLKRGHYTILHNPYLTTRVPDGVDIDTAYDGDYTVIVP